MSSIVSDAPLSKVIVGVDTHKHIHVAVAINQHGTLLGDRAVSADSGGYAQSGGMGTGTGSGRPVRDRGHRQLRGWANQLPATLRASSR